MFAIYHGSTKFASICSGQLIISNGASCNIVDVSHNVNSTILKSNLPLGKIVKAYLEKILW